MKETIESNWMVLARVEDNDALCGNDPITPETLRALCETYNPEFRKAPVVCGYDEATKVAGPTHETGEYLPPLGFVRALDFDGLNLWADVEEVIGEDGIGKVAKAVAKGFIQRSIGWWKKLTEVKNKPYLRHFVLVGGEVPGTANLPSLEHYFRTTEGDLNGRIVAMAPFCVRSITDQRPAPVPDSEGVKPEDDEMNEQEIRSLVASMLGEFASKLPAQVDAEALARTAAEAAAKAIAPTIDGLRTALDADRKSAQENLQAQRTAEYDRRIGELVSSGRVSPAEAKSVRTFHEGLPHEKVTEHLDSLARRTPATGLSQSSIIEIGDGDASTLVEFDKRDYSFPNGQSSPEPLGLRTVAEARARAKSDDPTKVRTELLKLVKGA